MQPKTPATPPPNSPIGPAFSDLGLSDPILKALVDVRIPGPPQDLSGPSRDWSVKPANSLAPFLPVVC